MALDDRAARYVLQVLRLRSGHPLTLFNGDGRDWSATLEHCHRRTCRARVIELLSDEQPARLSVHLGIGVSRGERMDLVVQKAVELGVTAITPLQATRSVVQLDSDRASKRLQHWRGVLISACEQSGRSRLPVLHPIGDVSLWVKAQSAGLLLDHRATSSLTELEAPNRDIALLVGPEGGLSDAERELAVSEGFTSVRLGPRILRTETAPLAALAAIQTLWGDYR